MRMYPPASFTRRPLVLGAVSLVAAAGLTSCFEEKAEPPAHVQEQTTVVEEAAPPAVDVAREALYRQLLENIAPLVTDHATVAEFNEPAKVYLEALEAYYKELAALPPSVERVDIARRVAELKRNLGAYAKAVEDFETAMADFELLPEEARQSVEGRRVLSALHNGLGVCLLSIEKAGDAISHYEAALELDMAVMRDLGVTEDTVLPESNPDPNVSRAVADVLGSYRCLGECHAVAGDYEEARDIYKKGIELMTKLQQLDLNSSMGIAYVKLYGALGDLENRCGNEREALNHWVQAANYCNAIFKGSRILTIKAQAKRFFDTLSPLIVDKSRKMQAAAQASQAAEAAREAEEAEKAAREAAAAQAAEEARAAEEAARAAEAEKAAAAREAEEAREQRRNRRNRRRNR